MGLKKRCDFFHRVDTYIDTVDSEQSETTSKGKDLICWVVLFPLLHQKIRNVFDNSSTTMSCLQMQSQTTDLFPAQCQAYYVQTTSPSLATVAVRRGGTQGSTADRCGLELQHGSHLVVLVLLLLNFIQDKFYSWQTTSRNLIDSLQGHATSYTRICGSRNNVAAPFFSSQFDAQRGSAGCAGRSRHLNSNRLLVGPKPTRCNGSFCRFKYHFQWSLMNSMEEI